MIEIVLQYALSNSDKTHEAFIAILSYLQDYLNNFKISTDYISNKLMYRFHVNDMLNTLSSMNLSSENYDCIH